MTEATRECIRGCTLHGQHKPDPASEESDEWAAPAAQTPEFGARTGHRAPNRPSPG